MKTLWRIIFFVREYLFPSGCALCGGGLLDPEEAWYGLCRSCMESSRLNPAEVSGESRCGRCGRPLISEEGECLTCREGGDRECGRIFTLFPYTGRYRKLLAAYKFGKSRGLGHFLAEQIRRFLGSLPPGEREQWEKTVWVPVPPRPGKLKSSGWDQVEYLSRLLEKEFPVSRCLKRLPSRSQKELDRKNRKTNLRGRIRCIKKAPAEAVLLDDLVTTGSTLDACAEALKAGGAETVRGFCLFYD